VFPHRSDDVVVEPYNSVLTLKRLKHHADAVTVSLHLKSAVGEPVEQAHTPASVGRDAAAAELLHHTAAVNSSPPLAGDGRAWNAEPWLNPKQTLQVLDNPALDAIASQQLGHANPSVDQMNSLAALAMAATTATLRFPGARLPCHPAAAPPGTLAASKPVHLSSWLYSGQNRA
jgi:hypothetical protein